jgi:hypothetical protein
MASHRIGAAQYLGRSSDGGDPRHLNTTFLAMKRPNPLIRAVDVDLDLSKKTVPVWLVRPPFGALFGLRQTRDLHPSLAGGEWVVMRALDVDPRSVMRCDTSCGPNPR